MTTDEGSGAERLHGWFGLSYASYLVLPRSILREMPSEWQGRLFDLLQELGETFEDFPEDGCYHVQVRDEDTGDLKDDRLGQYRHPDRPYIESLRKDHLAGAGEGIQLPTVPGSDELPPARYKEKP